MSDIIHYKTGKLFTPPLVNAGYLLLAVAVGLLVILNPLSIIPGIIGSLLAFSYSGIELDPTEKRYRQYNYYIGVKTGSWESLSPYPFLTILSSSQGYSATSRAGVTMKATERGFDICLLSKTHRNKLVIHRVKGQEEAKEAAVDLARRLGVTLADYKPLISEKTAARRRK